jgi:hypothetical protein
LAWHGRQVVGLSRPPRLPRAGVIAAVTPAMRTFLTE